jgi:hypothetical protein
MEILNGNSIKKNKSYLLKNFYISKNKIIKYI